MNMDKQTLESLAYALKVFIIAFVAALICSTIGCASLKGGEPMRVEATPTGATVGFNPTSAGQELWNWIKESPGKIIFGAFCGYVGRDYARSKGM